ncbi:MAG TPA: MBL fold metallo-hydrolase [Deltaproteobacteria bacterium]|nr:MBL fold metallo-hydrolase [Deltaproteobacteria bacterium]HCP45316.1 MBL fold metallo-hydrolase [Deltaproteobacteria bacterium]
MAEIVETLAVGALGCNCSVLAGPDGKSAVVVDPGDEAQRIEDILRTQGLDLVAIVHTHAHFDHILATGALARATGAEVWLHRADLPLYDNVEMQTSMFGMPVDVDLPAPDRFFEHGDEVAIGEGETLSVLHTPGHTPGSVCFHAMTAGLLFSGDTLFRMGIGRTDLWGGSYPQMMESIRQRLLTLPPETKVIPGHGPSTTIHAEARANPFLS